MKYPYVRGTKMAALALLSLFYLCLLYLMYHPAVTVEYRAFYMDRSTKISQNRIARTPAVKAGETYTPGDRHLLFDFGWSPPRKGEVDLDAGQARLLFKLDGPIPPSAFLILNYSLPGATEAKAFLNQENPTVFPPGVETKVFSAATLRPGPNELKILSFPGFRLRGLRFMVDRP